MVYHSEMTEILLAMASWLVVNVITWLSGKLNLSKTYVSVGLSIVIWIILYVWQLLVNKYPVARETVVEFILWAYGTSQIVYNIYKKIIE